MEIQMHVCGQVIREAVVAFAEEGVNNLAYEELRQMFIDVVGEHS